VNLLVIPKRGGKSEQVFEHDFRSLEETNLWPRKMGKEVGDGEPGAGADAVGKVSTLGMISLPVKR